MTRDELIDQLQVENIRLKADHKSMKEALSFYSNEKNWMTTRKDELHEGKMTIIGDPRTYGVKEYPGQASKLLVIGGMTAEKTLSNLQYKENEK